MTKAFAYLRVSGKGQVKGDGFTRQLQAIKTYSAEHDIKIVQVFREEGVAGTKESMDRPAWSAMISALLSNGVKTIIIEKLDRLARDLMVQEATIADLQKSGFALISVAEPDLMAKDPTRILMRQLMGAVAQYDKSQIVLKLRGARMRKRALPQEVAVKAGSRLDATRPKEPQWSECGRSGPRDWDSIGLRSGSTQRVSLPGPVADGMGL